MASELRIIRFKLDEVSTAVKAYAMRMNLSFPTTTIEEAYAAPDGTPNALLRYRAGEGDVAISNNRLAASLIAYCQIIKIPLPRAGKKSVRVAKDHVDLRISTADTGTRPSAFVVARGLGMENGSDVHLV